MHHIAGSTPATDLRNLKTRNYENNGRNLRRDIRTLRNYGIISSDILQGITPTLSMRRKRTDGTDIIQN